MQRLERSEQLQQRFSTMKAKNLNDGDLYPRHCYFWIATLPNNQVIPEYDFDNQIHNKTRDLPLELVLRFCWYPVTMTMIERVKETLGKKYDREIDKELLIRYITKVLQKNIEHAEEVLFVDWLLIEKSIDAEEKSLGKAEKGTEKDEPED